MDARQAQAGCRETFLVFGAPAMGDAEMREVAACVQSGWLGTGPRVAQFEQAFASYKGVSHAIALHSCTAALHLSMIVAGIGPGDEVVTSALTFCATANAIVHAGATPVIAEVDPETMNIDPASLSRSITRRTRALVPVHFAGRPCSMDELLETADAHSLLVIEDCAHAIETEWHGQKAGTFGDFGCFSFYVTKNIAAGEGGMVVTRSEDAAARIKTLALHGMTKDAWRRFGDEGYKHYQVVEAGFKYSMMDLQAAIAIPQLARVEENWVRRQVIWRRYQDAFADLPVTCPSEPEPDTRHAYHLYTILVDVDRCGITRDAFLDAMTARNIGVGVHYVSLAEQPFYRRTYGWAPEDVPNATRIGRQTVSLPLSPALSDRDVSDVIAAVQHVVAR